MLAFEEFGNATRVVDDLDAASKLSHGIVEYFAVFIRQNRDDVIGTLFQQLLESEHDLRALCGWGITPRRKRGVGRSNCVFDGRFAGHGNMARHLARGWIRYGQRPVVVRDVLAANKVPEDVCGIDILCGSCVHDVSR